MNANKCNYCGAPLSRSSFRCDFCGQSSIGNLDINLDKFNLNRKEITYKILKSIKRISIYSKTTGKNLYRQSKIIYKEYLSFAKNEVNTLKDKTKLIYAKDQTKKILFRYLPIGATSITLIAITSIIINNYNQVQKIDRLEKNGIKEFNDKQYKKAINSFNKAILLNPNKSKLANIYLYRGRSYLKRSSERLAIIDLSKANKLNPNNYEILFYLGNSYYADYDGDGDYFGYNEEEGTDEYVGYSTNWGNGDIEESGWVLEV